MQTAVNLLMWVLVQQGDSKKKSISLGFIDIQPQFKYSIVLYLWKKTKCHAADIINRGKKSFETEIYTFISEQC